MNVRIHPFGEDVKNTGRRSRPVMLNLGVRRPVGAEPEAQVNALYWRPRSCRIYSPASSCSTSSRPCDVVVTSPQVRLRLTIRLNEIGPHRRLDACHFLITIFPIPKVEIFATDFRSKAQTAIIHQPNWIFYKCNLFCLCCRYGG